MSHLVTIKTEVRDPIAIRAACGRLGLPVPAMGETRFFDGQFRKGWLVQLSDWLYPIVCDTATGEVHADNYHGRWGKQAELDRFTQAYAVCKATMEAKRKGYRVAEAKQPDGSIRLTVSVGG